MSSDTEHKSSAELQREIEMQRNRVENTIDEISAKLSPGQLVDELLAYTKGSGGEFVSTLQRQVTANPLPVALLGVSLAWLMAKPASGDKARAQSDRAWDDSINRNRGYAASSDIDENDYPVTIISGSSLRRQSLASDAQGRRISRFSDDAGKTYSAESDEHGNRASHFVDEAGNRFKGFTDATGARIEHFRDEAGNALEEASGWASHTWQKARERMHDLRDAAGSGMHSGRSHAGDMAGSALHGVEGLQQTVLHQFRDQPLVGGALAFALGAALGSALPHTREEDKLIGEAADALKAKAGAAVQEGYEEGRDKAAEVYETATEKAAEVYGQVKDGLRDKGANDGGIQ
ncbi:DUF3618 domain-containing protein [Devosia sp. Leaf64]|jgi:vacuolar-type H+-ATPase subunit H|uniref:DUF3618 domain-containing protein n=1 Tax=Devosia sp. Leaf64 TaxID=1736229 RepID=UPI000712C976|nr:DUF3618 domain-containing protein [Devosia sp. Leaf64]KQN75209.1 hypothetical protein ASE94_02510 [Devosia sp. Leaf64]